MSQQKIIAGVEGGSSNTIMVLLDSNGKVLTKVKGTGTNHFLIGIDECIKRIKELASQAKKEAGLSDNVPFAGLGLSLSGCEQESSNQLMIKKMKDTYPNLSEHYAIGSDTLGSIATASGNGGIVCIAGTGSNTLLINPDESKLQCGGWGYILGDEGSAWNIAHRAVKFCFDSLDGLANNPYPVDKIWQLVKDHFGVNTQPDLLEFFYTRFDKSLIAKLGKKISVLAGEGDELSKFLFKEAGTSIAKSLGAVIPKADKELINKPGGLHVVCVGSVWLSWNLLQPGFVSWLQQNVDLKEATLLRLNTTSAVGAAYMVADKAKLNLPRDYTKNYEVLYHYLKTGCKTCNN